VPVDALELSGDGLLMRVEGGVFELFRVRHFHSFRTPLSWLTVGVEFRRSDKVRLTIGTAVHPDQAMYGTTVRGRSEGGQLLLPAFEEQRFRAYFTQVAALAGRVVEQ
jgi:hypothetical protein